MSTALKESPLLALQVKTDTFGVPLSPDSDAVLKKLQTAEIEELEKKELHCMLCLLIGGIVEGAFTNYVTQQGGGEGVRSIVTKCDVREGGG